MSAPHTDWTTFRGPEGHGRILTLLAASASGPVRTEQAAWRRFSEGLTDQADRLAADRRTVEAHWDGQAADAAVTAATRVRTRLLAAATTAASLAADLGSVADAIDRAHRAVPAVPDRPSFDPSAWEDEDTAGAAAAQRSIAELSAEYRRAGAAMPVPAATARATPAHHSGRGAAVPVSDPVTPGVRPDVPTTTTGQGTTAGDPARPVFRHPGSVVPVALAPAAGAAVRTRSGSGRTGAHAGSRPERDHGQAGSDQEQDHGQERDHGRERDHGHAASQLPGDPHRSTPGAGHAGTAEGTPGSAGGSAGPSGHRPDWETVLPMSVLGLAGSGRPGTLRHDPAWRHAIPGTAGAGTGGGTAGAGGGTAGAGGGTAGAGGGSADGDRIVELGGVPGSGAPAGQLVRGTLAGLAGSVVVGRGGLRGLISRLGFGGAPAGGPVAPASGAFGTPTLEESAGSAAVPTGAAGARAVRASGALPAAPMTPGGGSSQDRAGRRRPDWLVEQDDLWGGPSAAHGVIGAPTDPMTGG